MRLLNVFRAELENGPGREGFWFRAAALGEQLHAARIGAAVYEARAEIPIWPYHYHYPSEEWLYVLDGTPVLRDPGGRRALAVGDVVCFPAGHRGAHTLEGPGTFLLFSSHDSTGPYVSVYPDSDKVSLYPVIESGRINSMLLPRAEAVDYWHGEGAGETATPTVTREPDAAGQPVCNALRLGFEQSGGAHSAALNAHVGGERLEVSVLELMPGADSGRYHHEHGRELWLLVVAGTPTLRHADGEQALSVGDLVCLPEGPAGGRSLHNRSVESARIVLLSSAGLPAATHYPDSGEWVLRTAPDAEPVRLRGV